jgi:hypothetical protein
MHVQAQLNWNFDARFPLTPALFPKERECCTPSWLQEAVFEWNHSGKMVLPLPRERAGVRGKVMNEFKKRFKRHIDRLKKATAHRRCFPVLALNSLE